MRYLSVQFKRTVRAYKNILAVTLVMLAAMLTVAGVMLSENSKNEGDIRAKVGMVGDGNDRMLKLCFSMLEHTDATRYTIEFSHFTTEADAIDSLRNNNLNAYIVVPEGFSDALMNGEVKQIRYVMAKSSESLSTALSRDVVLVVNNYIAETQAGLSGAWAYTKAISLPKEERYRLDTDMSIDYANLITDRENYVEITELGLGNSLSDIGYYVCGFTVFFLLIWGIACSSVRVHTTRALPRILRSRGLSTAAQVVGEYIPYLLSAIITVLIIFVGAGVTSAFIEFPIAELEYLLPADFLVLAVKLVPAIFALTAVQFLLYELVSGMINSVLVQFAIAAVLGYLGGCFYPIYFFPETVQRFSAVMPTGVAFNYFSGLLTGNTNKDALTLCAIYGVGALLFSALIRRGAIKRAEG